ncbi:phosphatidylinositol-specific phospholipase C [Elizabethkingia meningoseptica]|uniref:phosphatidylinositol-specific phospholipase C n=1 Tax=Elizabethkingia meningoseptica TaxID=238 RepID=UPI0022F18232|nr:phosphatidylinositol-specific phospholipase C [Elizabethkingia meningoseptica]EJK5330180.1 phosphatidylinositol-specific phospholipase C [Elizabethkingia meningoseptica]MDE5467839.1 phosphatidylinositol-specific phospholipase C [Elizabethkingia meningoseptica]MDE5474758.1 phosphatidylinositol-specific phospholipase C [Elizabethkingia meningoseptica]MDE5478191.1 phosphatidylinositol-specific phospholipase C [Elizabethkingia meningoseptica]MDE5486098.1 phosphatidylinositol-specific phospholip
MKNKINIFLTVAVINMLFSCSENLTERDLNDKNLTLSAQNNARVSLATIGIDNWMSGLQDQISLAKISVPGTHDSGATIEIPSNSGTAKTQNLSISEQLNIGVRFLDIRCRHIDNAFTIHHGPIYQKINFDDVLNACYAFLESHPTETIIMSVKEEHNPSNVSRSFEKTFDSYVQKNPSKWDLGNTIPTLGEVRGKIKLLRRFPADDKPKGIEATSWSDNTTFEINTPARIKIQDNYKVDNNDTKWTQIQTVLNEAKATTDGKLFINFTSGYKPLIFGIPSIPTVSNAINPKVKTFFQSNPKGTYGILAIDFVSKDLTEPIVNTNF